MEALAVRLTALEAQILTSEGKGMCWGYPAASMFCLLAANLVVSATGWHRRSPTAAKRALKTQIMGAAKQLKKLADEHENVKSIWSQCEQ